MWAALRALLRRRPPVEAPAAPASVPVVIPPRRAQGPALRVHLCVVCARTPVRQAGDACSPCMQVARIYEVPVAMLARPVEEA